MAERLDKSISASTKVEVVLAPPFIALERLKHKLSGLKFGLAAQNIHYVDEGKFTGEISATMIRDLAEYVIVGHSERRHIFHETDPIVARKVAAAVRNGITPILCVGEELPQRLENQALRVLHDQLTTDLMLLTAADVGDIVVAYEPPWSISSGDGHGAIAKPDQIEQALKFIRKTVKQLYGKTAAEKMRLLYGGSINPDFSKDYLRIKELDGFLVGGVSLKEQEFARIVKDAQSIGRRAFKK